MTQFSQLELIYNQFLNLLKEIDIFIENEEYEAAVDKLEHKDNLLKKLILTKKTVNFTPEEQQKIQLIEQEIREKEKKALDNLEKLQNDVAIELSSTKAKVKINSAYTIQSEAVESTFIDISE